MPRVHVIRGVALGDGRAYDVDSEVDMTPEQAQAAVAGDWGELVREQRPETPEGSRSRRTSSPERRAP